MMKMTGIFGAAIIACALTSFATAQVPRGACMVADPTGTPLNVRDAPNGAVLGSLDNGQAVELRGVRRDRAGRAWGLVAEVGGARLGWVYREYIVCR